MIRFLPSSNPIWRSRSKSHAQGGTEKSVPCWLQTARWWTLFCSAACNALVAVVANNPARKSRRRMFLSLQGPRLKLDSLPLCQQAVRCNSGLLAGARRRQAFKLAKSELDHSRHFGDVPVTSGLPRSADILRAIRHVAKVAR